MKKAIIFLFALLVLAAQAQAQGKQPLAVLVIGVDNWMFGDVLAHIVGAELNRSKQYAVVTRDKLVQTKLKELRRASEVNFCDVRAWAKANGLSAVCLVKGLPGGNAKFSFTSNAQQSYSAYLIDVAGNSVSCSADFTFNHAGSLPKEMTPTELNKVAWEVVGRLQSSSCKPPSYIRCFDFEPEMVFVKGGKFTMGCMSGRDTQSGASCVDDYGYTTATTTVTVSDFWIGKYEVTQKEWEALKEAYYPGLGINLFNSGSGDKYPVYGLSYEKALLYISGLNDRTGKVYRFPTEAEWEYAARGGNAPKNCTGGCEYSGSNAVGSVSWYSNNSGGTSHEVGGLAANELGIYDMSGNVWELCQDWRAEDGSLPDNNSKDPQGPAEKPETPLRVMRGGAWFSAKSEKYCRVAYRSGMPYNEAYPHAGFRVVVSAAP